MDNAGIIKKNYLPVLFLIASLLPYFIISFYCHPAADDFIYAFNGKHLSLPEILRKDYLHWSGRYVSILLGGLNPMVFNSLILYRLHGVLMLLLVFISFHIFISMITGNLSESFRSKKFFFSLTLTLLFLFQIPILSEGIYWFSGSAAYTLGSIVALIAVVFLMRAITEKYFINKKIHLACLAALMIISPGFNEVTALIMISFLIVLQLILRHTSSTKRKFVLHIFILYCVCTAVVILSPGNTARGHFFPENHLFFHSLFFSLLQCIRFFIEWVTGIPLLMASLIYVPFSNRVSEKSELFKNSFYLKPLWSTGFLFLLIFLSAFPAYWGTGILGQHRTVNSAYFFFVILWFINLTVWPNYFKNKKIITKIETVSLKYSKIIFLLMIIFSFITKNGFTVMNDLISGRAKSFDKEMTQRYSIMKGAEFSSEKTLIIEPLKNKPASIFVLDITEDENYWINRGTAAYFGIHKVVLKKKSQP